MIWRGYLFREANSFPGAWLEENCELRAFALIVKDINLVSSSTQAQVFLSHLAPTHQSAVHSGPTL